MDLVLMRHMSRYVINFFGYSKKRARCGVPDEGPMRSMIKYIKLFDFMVGRDGKLES